MRIMIAAIVGVLSAGAAGCAALAHLHRCIRFAERKAREAQREAATARADVCAMSLLLEDALRDGGLSVERKADLECERELVENTLARERRNVDYYNDKIARLDKDTYGLVDAVIDEVVFGVKLRLGIAVAV